MMNIVKSKNYKNIFYLIYFLPTFEQLPIIDQQKTVNFHLFKVINYIKLFI